MAIYAKQKNNYKKQIKIKINKTAHITNTNNMNIYNNTNTNINTHDANIKLYGISLYNRLNIS